MSEDTSNPDYKLIMDNLQLVLIDVLIRSFLNTKVLQGSVATRLRCDGIFNDQFIRQSLLIPTVKKWKSVNVCEVPGRFLWNMVYIHEVP